MFEGYNGSGKTTILEALHYACYLRSFKTISAPQIISFGASAFSVSLEGITHQEPWHLQVGASNETRLVRLNNTSLNKHKQIFDYYRVITITEHDIELIAGYPQTRRAFLDTTLFLLDTEYGALIKQYTKVCKQRTAVLSHAVFDSAAYEIWTSQFCNLSRQIQEKRCALLKDLEIKVQELLVLHFPHGASVSLRCSYEEKKYDEDLLRREKALKRILFGAHLDDIHIIYGDSKARSYASRGQQKMLVMLFKLAVIQLLKKPVILLLDDFMTDFDQKKIENLLSAFVAENIQIIATCPMEQSTLSSILKRYNAQTVTLKPSDMSSQISPLYASSEANFF